MDVIALFGPPGSGKSTVSAHLCSSGPGLHVFRLREMARAQAVTDHQLAQELTQTRDPLGWLPDATATLLVRRALKTLCAAAVLLEGYPGNEVQARALAHDSARERWRLTAIELNASSDVCAGRVQQRRVCPVCDPHRRRPARSTPLGRCQECGEPLEQRRSDHGTSASLRQIRYRANATGLRAALRSAGAAWHTVDAEQDTASVVAAALAALSRHTTQRRGSPTLTPTPLPTPTFRKDEYGHARMPVPADATAPQKIDRVEYGRFRNVYLYITEACQLRCSGCYMGDRLERALKMPYEQIGHTLSAWRQMGGSKLTILGGEPTLHPRYEDVIRLAGRIGYEHVITTSNGLAPARRKFRRLEPSDFAYVQISVDGGSATTHDAVRGAGKFNETLVTLRELCERGFDTRIICTVSKRNEADCLRLLDIADQLGVSLVKYHVMSIIGRGHGSPEDGMEPREWLDFTDRLRDSATGYTTRCWYQPTFARRSEMPRFEAEGYRGCIGRTLDRISLFPDGRAYVCSFLFDTDLHFATTTPDGRIELSKGDNEFDLFTGALTKPGCGGCKAPASCMGGCPAELVVDGRSSCETYPDIVPVCRLWKSIPAN